MAECNNFKIILENPPQIRGDKGAKGDAGISSYLFIRYASDANGTNISSIPDDTLSYLGIAVTNTPAVPPANSFLWWRVKGVDGEDGENGTKTYFYLAFADDANGTGFSLTDHTKPFTAWKTSPIEIVNPQAGDFTDLWVRYIGIDGQNGASAFFYRAWADDINGTNFSLVDYTKPFEASISTDTEIVSPTSSDFEGLWRKWKGEDGVDGRKIEIIVSGEILKYRYEGDVDYIDLLDFSTFHGQDGEGNFIYLAYADDIDGNGFTTTFDMSKPYIAFKSVSEPITTLTANDFTGLWSKYHAESDRYSTTSSTQNLVGLGSKNFILEKDLAYVTGIKVLITRTGDVDTKMIGFVETYDPISGSASFDIREAFNEGGSYSAWSISRYDIASSGDILKFSGQDKYRYGGTDGDTLEGTITIKGRTLIANSDVEPFQIADRIKLDSIEAGATADQIGAEIRAAYGAEPDTNHLTDARASKLDALEESKFKGLFPDLASLQAAYPTGEPGWHAYVDTGVGNPVQEYIWDDTDTAWEAQVGNTTAETASSVKTKYESNADTNAYTDAYKTKLDGIEVNATNVELLKTGVDLGINPTTINFQSKRFAYFLLTADTNITLTPSNYLGQSIYRFYITKDTASDITFTFDFPGVRTNNPPANSITLKGDLGNGYLVNVIFFGGLLFIDDSTVKTDITLSFSAPDKFIYSGGSNNGIEATVTAFARTLLDDADAADARTTLDVHHKTWIESRLGTALLTTLTTTDKTSLVAAINEVKLLLTEESIKSLYESNLDTNAFTNAYKDKIDNVFDEELGKEHYSYFNVASGSVSVNRNRFIVKSEDKFWTLGAGNGVNAKFGYFDLALSELINLSGTEIFNHFDVYNGVPYLIDGSETGKLVKYENGVFTNIDISATVGTDSLNFIEIYDGIAYIAGNAALYKYDIVGETAGTILTCNAGIICMEYSTSNKLYIAGFFTSLTLTGGSAETHNYIAEYDIVLDTLTSIGTGLNVTPTKLEYYSDKLYIYGSGITLLNNVTINRLASIDISDYTVNNLNNPSLTGSGTVTINDFTITSNGKIVVVGNFETIDNVEASNIAFYDTDTWKNITFIEDNLQLGIQQGTVDNNIKFITKFSDYGLWLSGGSSSYVLSQGLYWYMIRSYYYEKNVDLLETTEKEFALAINELNSKLTVAPSRYYFDNNIDDLASFISVLQPDSNVYFDISINNILPQLDVDWLGAKITFICGTQTFVYTDNIGSPVNLIWDNVAELSAKVEQALLLQHTVREGASSWVITPYKNRLSVKSIFSSFDVLIGVQTKLSFYEGAVINSVKSDTNQTVIYYRHYNDGTSPIPISGTTGAGTITFVDGFIAGSGSAILSDILTYTHTVSGNYIVDFTDKRQAQITLQADITELSFTADSIPDGDSVEILFIQDATGNQLVDDFASTPFGAGTTFETSGSVFPVINTDPNGKTLWTIKRRGTMFIIQSDEL